MKRGGSGAAAGGRRASPRRAPRWPPVSAPGARPRPSRSRHARRPRLSAAARRYRATAVPVRPVRPVLAHYRANMIPVLCNRDYRWALFRVKLYSFNVKSIELWRRPEIDILPVSRCFIIYERYLDRESLIIDLRWIFDVKGIRDFVLLKYVVCVLG